MRAARDLGVNQTTVIRRLDALEEKLGTPLFDRQRTGNTLTAAGRTVAGAAERMEQEARGLESALAAQQRSLSGSVRLTTSEVLATRFIVPGLKEFRREHPNVTVELLVSDERLDIARGEADVALRGGSRPEGAGVVGRRLQDVEWTVYCSRGYAAERGAPSCRDQIPGHDIVALDGRMAQLPSSQWLAAAAQGAPIRYSSNSMSNLVTTLKSGLGLGALPTIVGDAESELQRCFEPPKELVSELWLIVREEIKAHPHVRAFADYLACYIRETLVARS